MTPGLESVTVAPGITAPDSSLTVPPIAASPVVHPGVRLVHPVAIEVDHLARDGLGLGKHRPARADGQSADQDGNSLPHGQTPSNAAAHPSFSVTAASDSRTSRACASPL